MMKRRNGHQKVIRAQKHRDLWWIKNSEVFDVLIPGGFTTMEVSLFQMQASEDLFYSALVASGNENQKRTNPDSAVEYESDGDQKQLHTLHTWSPLESCLTPLFPNMHASQRRIYKLLADQS